MGTRSRGGQRVGGLSLCGAWAIVRAARAVAVAVAVAVMVVAWPGPSAQSFEGHRLYDPGAYVLLNLLAAADSGSAFMMLAVVRQAVENAPDEVEDIVAAAALLMPWLRDDIIDAALDGHPAPGTVAVVLRSVAAEATGLVPGTAEWDHAQADRPLPPRGLIERVAYALAEAEKRVTFTALADAAAPPRDPAAVTRAIPPLVGLPAAPVLPGPPPPESRYRVPSGS